jgi:7,8-dihydro-6-hydroxymethylpterin dimethyltransferase
VVEARVYLDGGRILLDKTCPRHGRFQDVYWSDSRQFERFESFRHEGEGIENPRTREDRGCPLDCGLCPGHKSTTLLAIVDVTNRCNLRCPVCFANSGVRGYVYEPTRDQIRAMLENVRNNRPLPTPALQFSGGEPTLRPDLADLVAMARDLGFLNIEVNTNGIRLAESLDLCRSLKDAGLHTIYLQFDSPDAEVHRRIRGRDLVEIKRQAIENCRRAEIPSVVLVVTLIKGVNDGHLGEIIRYAAQNRDIIRCVNIQPVAFTGRRPDEADRTGRITIPDVLALVEEQTQGDIRASDFYPVPSVVPVARAVGALKDEVFPEFTAHPHCGAGTYFFVEDGRITAINRHVNVNKFLRSLERISRTAAKGYRSVAGLMLLFSLRHVKIGMLRRFLLPILRMGTFEALADFHFKVVLVSCMHFMDAWNFDGERVRRCVIHYAVPDGRIIPFCAYNNLGYRDEVEHAFKTVRD